MSKERTTIQVRLPLELVADIKHSATMRRLTQEQMIEAMCRAWYTNDAWNRSQAIEEAKENDQSG